MRQFRINVFRLAKQNKGSFIGAVFIIAIGIFIYVAMMDTLKNLKGQVDAYYRESALADVFAEVSGISPTELERLKEIPGIKEVSGKMAEDIRLLAPGQETIVTVHLLSYDENDGLNKLALSTPMGKQDSLYLGSKMASAYGYEAGERMKLLWGGVSVDFEYAGVCHEPDYIYSIPPGGAMIPDGEVYDIACISRLRMEELTGRKDTLNELGFSLKPGYAFEDVRYQLLERLEMYGLVSLTPKEDQVSFSMLDMEIGALMACGTVMPAMFMAISVFMLYVVLKKMIDRDQALIGTMKAFGMRDRELMGAYLLEGAAAGAAGALFGCLFAMPFGKYMFDIYAEFFNLPDTVYHNYMGGRVSGFLIAVGTGLLAVFLGVRDILSITPAQAMRARTPAAAGRLPMPKFILRRLGPMERLGCRSIARNPFRGFLIVLAIGFPFSMASVLFSYRGVAEHMFMDQFEKVQAYDLQASLDGYTTPVKAAQGGEALPGVAKAEAVCIKAASIRSVNRSEFVMLYGLNRDSELWKIRDSQLVFYQPPQRGLIINSRIAQKLHVKRGDTLELTCPGMTVEAVSVPVTEIIEESLGGGCYMSLDSFGRLFAADTAANTVLLKVEDGKLGEVRRKLMETSHVSWLVDGRKIVDGYRGLMGSAMAMIGVLAILSVASGGILIYNISMINIRERATEFGTLMVLGETTREIGGLIRFEQLTYFVLGILAGFPGSYAIKTMLEHLVKSDSYTISMNVSPGAYAGAFAASLAITLLAWLAEVRFISRIELTDILKERE